MRIWAVILALRASVQIDPVRTVQSDRGPGLEMPDKVVCVSACA